MGNIIISASNNGHKKIPRLTENELACYEKETLFTGHEIIQLHAAFRKTCSSDASVDREDFIDMFSNYNKSAKSLLFLDHIFRTWDFENNGNLRFHDFLQALSVTSRGTRQQRSEYLFHLYDADRSGEITIDEFSSLLKLRLRKIELENLEDIFNAIDADGSGSVDYKEFVTACSTNKSLIEYLDLY